MPRDQTSPSQQSLFRACVLAVGALLAGGWPELTAAPSSDPGDEVHTADARDGTIWVVNRDRNQVVVFDARNGTILAPAIPVSAGAHDIAFEKGGRTAFVTSETSNALTLVSARNFSTGTVAVAGLPHHIEESRDGLTMYVGLVGVNRFARVDTDSLAVTYFDSSANPDARSHAPVADPKEDTIYVPHEAVGNNEVTAINLRDGTVMWSATAITQPSEVRPDKWDRDVYVSARGEGTLKRLDASTGSITGSIPIGVQPEAMLLTPDGKTMIVTLRGSPAQIAFVDVETFTVVGYTALAGAGSFGDLAVMSQDGSLVFATFDMGTAGTAGVAVVDVETRSRLETWLMPGTGRAHGIAFSKRYPERPWLRAAL